MKTKMLLIGLLVLLIGAAPGCEEETYWPAEPTEYLVAKGAHTGVRATTGIGEVGGASYKTTRWRVRFDVSMASAACMRDEHGSVHGKLFGLGVPGKKYPTEEMHGDSDRFAFSDVNAERFTVKVVAYAYREECGPAHPELCNAWSRKTVFGTPSILGHAEIGKLYEFEMAQAANGTWYRMYNADPGHEALVGERFVARRKALSEWQYREGVYHGGKDRSPCNYKLTIQQVHPVPPA